MNRSSKREASAATIVLQAINSLTEDYSFERSFKLVEGKIYSTRFLASFRESALGSDPLASLIALTKRLNIPDRYVAMIQHNFPSSDIFHLGYEQQEDIQICKLYMDFREPLLHAIKHRDTHTDTVLIHQAFKWDASCPTTCSVSNYQCNKPLLTPKEISERLAQIYEGDEGSFTYQAALDFIAATKERMAGKSMFLMEAEEEGNPRYSYDINVYGGEATLIDAVPVIRKIADHFSIDDEQWQPLIQGNEMALLGHLSGGTDRRAREFLTVYFGMETRSPKPPYSFMHG
ncbi:MAG: hypothetical protein ABJ056_14290 [Halioglobus sp.]